MTLHTYQTQPNHHTPVNIIAKNLKEKLPSPGAKNLNSLAPRTDNACLTTRMYEREWKARTMRTAEPPVDHQFANYIDDQFAPCTHTCVRGTRCGHSCCYRKWQICRYCKHLKPEHDASTHASHGCTQFYEFLFATINPSAHWPKMWNPLEMPARFTARLFVARKPANPRTIHESKCQRNSRRVLSRSSEVYQI